MHKNTIGGRAARACLFFAFAAILSAGTTAAAGSLTFVAPKAFGATGSPNNVFDVVLENFDTIPYNIAGEAFILTVPTGSGILFTNATTGTVAPYLFQSSADNNLAIALSDLVGPSTTFTSADAEDLPFSHRTINPVSGTISILGLNTFGVAHVTYTVDPSLAPGTVIPLVLTTFAVFPQALNDDSYGEQEVREQLTQIASSR